MTREEAIEYLVGMDIESLADGLNEAVTMAIEALHREEAEEKGYCHRVRPSNVEVVVRCKDCKYWEQYETWTACNYWSGDPHEQATTEADDFCSYGERR